MFPARFLRSLATLGRFSLMVCPEIVPFGHAYKEKQGREQRRCYNNGAGRRKHTGSDGQHRGPRQGHVAIPKGWGCAWKRASRRGVRLYICF